MPRSRTLSGSARPRLLTGFAVTLISCLNGHCSTTDCITLNGSELWSFTDDDEICLRSDLVITSRTEDDLKILAQVVRIEGSLVVTDNRELVELPVMTMLSHVDGSISISANESLTRVLGFPSLEHLGGELFIGENPRLTSLTGGKKLKFAEHIFFALNPELHTAAGFDSLEFVGGDLVLGDNEKLKSLTLPRLEAIGRNFSLFNNLSMTEIDLPNLETVSGFLAVRGLKELKTAKGLSTLVSVGSQLEISDCSSLVDFGLPDEVGQRITISNNDRLQEIKGGQQFTMLKNSTIEISDNPLLSKTEAFSNLEKLEALRITNNAKIQSVADWFPQISSIEDLWIFGNSELAPSDVERLLKRTRTTLPPRIGDNKGEDSSYDPCPWTRDGVCDDRDGTGLCLEDIDDC